MQPEVNFRAGLGFHYTLVCSSFGLSLSLTLAFDVTLTFSYSSLGLSLALTFNLTITFGPSITLALTLGLTVAPGESIGYDLPCGTDKNDRLLSKRNTLLKGRTSLNRNNRNTSDKFSFVPTANRGFY